MGPTSQQQLIKNMVKIKVPRGDFLLQWSPTLYVCENEKLRLWTVIGEMVKLFLIDIFRSGHGTTPPPKFLKF